jgi:hypothetical protein
MISGANHVTYCYPCVRNPRAIAVIFVKMRKLNKNKMDIVINDNRKIVAIQEEFSAQFPNLELFFHAKSGNSDGRPSEKIIRESSKTLNECRVMHFSGKITILPSMTIAELKSHFSDRYGLSVEISAKTTNGTKDYPVNEQRTLEELNHGQ